MTGFIGILCLLIALAALIFFTYRGTATAIITIACTIFIAITNGLPIWGTISEVYMPSFAGIVQSYALIFMSSSIYAGIMEATGSTITVGRSLVKAFGKKSALIVCSLVVAVLNYGGISLWVVMFAAGPIMFYLLKEADLPRHLCMACLTIGAVTWTMTCLPGSTALTNVIPAEQLGTPLTAAPVLSIVATVMLMAMQVWYLKKQEKRARLHDEHWTFPDGINAARFDEQDESKLPGIVQAYAPIVLLLVMIIGSSILKLPLASNSTMLVVVSMVCAFFLCLILNFKYLDKGIAKILMSGCNSGFGAILGLSCLVAFGSVVSSTVSFQEIIDWLLALDITPYWKGTITASVLAGVTGSSSGGARLCCQYLGEYFAGSDVNLEVLHRLISIAAGSLDSLPHSSGWPAMLGFFGLTYKTGYKHPFWLSVVQPLIVVLILTAVVSIVL